MNASARPYRMVVRAAKAAATADRILEAATRLFWAEPTTEISLDRVAAHAGVTVQTVIRRFGGRDGLFAAAAARESERVAAERDPELVRGRPEAAIRQLLDHYEAMGDGVLRMLAEEVRTRGLQEVAEAGRRFHRGWCETVFDSSLAGLDPETRERRVAQLVAVCDVYTWKLLRRDSRLPRPQTERALMEMLTPLLEGS